MFPYCIYDTKRCQMIHLGLFKDEADCWRMYLGWPTKGEVRTAQERGFVCLPCTVSYKPPELTPCDAKSATEPEGPSAAKSQRPAPPATDRA